MRRTPCGGNKFETAVNLEARSLRKTPKLMKKILSLLLTAAVFSLGHGSPAAVPPAEKLLPEDTLALLSIPDSARPGTFTAARRRANSGRTPR